MPASGETPANLAYLKSGRIGDGVTPFVFEKIFTASTTTSYLVTVAAFRFRVINAFTINASAPAGVATVQVMNGTTAVSSAINCNVADETIALTTTIDDASDVFNPGDTMNLAIAGANAANLAARVYIMCIPIE